MKYQAPDGHIMISSPNESITYLCPAPGVSDGIYESLETASSLHPLGIKQIKITRRVEDEQMTITVVESTYAELQQYLDDVTPKKADDETLPDVDFNNLLN